MQRGADPTYTTHAHQTILGCCYPRDNKLDEGLMQAFVAAYDAKRPMSAEEKAKLPLFIQYAALTIAFWRFRYAPAADADGLVCHAHSPRTHAHMHARTRPHRQFNVRTQDALRKDRHEEMVQRIAQIAGAFLLPPPPTLL
jgi:Ser/Thr protein kinase RdoA (MazF antagonist)